MNKTTVQQISLVVKGSPFADNVKIFVDAKDTGGFWSMAIKCEDENIMSQIRNTADAIGKLCGERLHFQTSNEWMEIS